MQEIDAFPFHIMWHIVWDITRRCNLRCNYCTVDKHEDVQAGNREAISCAIRRYAPEYLILTGGEPTLVAELPELLKKVKEDSPDSKIILNTNGLLLDAIMRLLPYLSRLAISLDSLDESNFVNRGISAEKVVRNITTLCESEEVKSQTVQVSVAAVVTRETLASIPAITQGLKKIDSKIEIDFKPMLPYEDARSPFSMPAMKQQYFALAKDYQHVAHFYGTGHSKRLVSPFLCWGQFFKMDINPQGTELTCRNFTQANGKLQILPCPAPCDCTEYIDDILFSRSPLELTPPARYIFDHMRKETLMKTEHFIQTYIEPAYRCQLVRYK